MKIAGLTLLLAVSGAAAWSTPSRRDIRNLGQKSVGSAGRRQVGSSIKMEGMLIVAISDKQELERIIGVQLA